MKHLKKFEEIDLGKFKLKSPSEIAKGVSSLFSTKSKFQSRLEDQVKKQNDPEEQERIKRETQEAIEYENKISEIDKRVAKEQNEFLVEWKEICEDIKSCLLDIKDFSDSFEESKVIDNYYRCIFYVDFKSHNDRNNTMVLHMTDNLSKLFEHINNTKEYLKSVDPEIIMYIRFGNGNGDSYLELNFEKPTDLYSKNKRKKPDRFSKYLDEYRKSLKNPPPPPAPPTPPPLRYSRG